MTDFCQIIRKKPFTKKEMVCRQRELNFNPPQYFAFHLSSASRGIAARITERIDRDFSWFYSVNSGWYQTQCRFDFSISDSQSPDGLTSFRISILLTVSTREGDRPPTEPVEFYPQELYRLLVSNIVIPFYVGRDNSVDIATYLRTGRSDDRILVEGDIFRTRPDRPRWSPSSFHPPPSSAEVKESVDLYIYSPSGPSWLVKG